MAEEKRRAFSPPPVGGASLLAAFAVLCLTVFALLSLATVQANRRLSDAAARAVTDYYAADCQAQEILARLRSGEEPENVDITEDASLTPLWTSRCTYTVPISDSRELQVEVLLNGVSGSYSVLRWQAVSAGEWEIDDSLELWDGTPF